MKKQLIHLATSLILIFISLNHALAQPKVVVLGSVHFPTQKVNADSIYSILQKFQPDIILLEADSTNFYDDFTFKHLYDENEYIATVRYKMKNPLVNIRPIEFEGRNSYRKSIGIYPEAGPVWQKLNQLNNEKKFNKEEQKIWDELAYLDSVASAYKNASLQGINQPKIDQIINNLIISKYLSIKKIVDTNPIFAESKLIDAKKDTVTMRQYFALWANFEGNLRNNAIANNVMKQIKLNPGKKIIVITGFYHRPFILNKLAENKIPTHEFYQIK